jgi:hypothetical protein
MTSFMRALMMGCIAMASTMAAAQVSVSVSKPANDFTGPSPMQFEISANSTAATMSSMAISVDGTEIFFQWGNSFTAYLWLAKGKHTVVVTGTDVKNNTGSKTLQVNSTNGMGTVTNINNWGAWEVCTTSNCVGGGGEAVSDTYPDQTTPSLDRSSREFTLAGLGPYSNAYWYAFIGGSDSATNFTFDTWVLINKPANPQALELDVNQSFNQKRWVFGTQCNYKGGAPLGGYWNVWNGATSQWVSTSVPCKPFAANTWHHVVWAVIRTGNFVHYVSVEIDGVSHGVNLQLGNQPNWTGADIDVSVQLDGDSNQDPYDVWIDEMKLTAF